jgi:hypothetical protein
VKVSSERVSFRHWTKPLCVCVAVIYSHASFAEPFIGQFELKTLESEPGSFEFQSQNAWASGQPRRQIALDDDGELLMDENSLFRARYALELEIGITERLKMRVGVEFEDERIDDPEALSEANAFEGLELAEIGAEIVAILVQREGDGVGLGVVAEIEGPIDQEGANRFIVGPIVEYQAGAWFFAAVPMLVRSFGEDGEVDEPADSKWDFAYATQVMRRFSDRWSVAMEGYGTIDRIGDSGRPSAAAQRFGDFDQHRLGPVVYYAHSFGGRRRYAAASDEAEAASLTIGLGAFEGLNSNTPNHTIKLSIEVDF